MFINRTSSFSKIKYAPTSVVFPVSDTKRHFITFGGNSKNSGETNRSLVETLVKPHGVLVKHPINYHNAVCRICNQASLFRLFDTITGCTERFLQQDSEFWEKHREFIESNSRGYGYWIWKPYIIKKQLEKMNENDVLVYVDSGCEMNVLGVQRLYEYMAKTAETDTGILGFIHRNLYEKEWTKMDVFAKMDAYEFADTTQISANALFIRKCSASVEIINEWYDTCCDYSVINDTPSTIPNDPAFQEHRHDQSILSILLKKHKCLLLYDETFLPQDIRWSFPIWGLRNRDGVSLIYK